MKIDNIENIYFTEKMGDWSQKPSFEGFCFDSREVRNNFLFIAHKGDSVDANKYIEDAYNKKASFIVSDNKKYVPENIDIPVLITDKVIETMLNIVREIRKRNKKKKIIAITGTTGKTSTKDILYSVLSEKLNVGKTEGNMNTEWGVPYTFLNNMDKDVIVVEMGMDHPEDIKILTKALKPDYCVVTNISPVHLEYMKSMENIYRGKTDLFRYSDEKSFKLIKGDDKYHKKALDEFENIYSYGKNRENHYRFQILKNGSNINFAFQKEIYKLDLWGEFNVYNCIPAIVMGEKLDLDNIDIKKGLSSVNLSSNRINIISKNNKVVINDTYNSSPYAVKAVVDEINKKYRTMNKILVLGDMLELGEYANKYHREVMEYIRRELFNFKCFLLGENFYNLKNEYPEAKFYLSKDNLIEDIKKHLNETDVLLFKASRGLKLEMVLNKILGSL